MRYPAIIALILLLGACTSWAVFDGISVMSTKKTMEDHIISISSGKNCSILRRERGLTYCREDEAIPVKTVYCYRTLGRVTCYDKPDPHKGRHQEVGRNDHNLVRKR